MVLAIVGVVTMLFSVMVYFVAQRDFNQNPWDFTPFEDEALMILVTQKMASFFMDILYIGVLFLGAYLIVTGLGSLV